MPTTPQTEPVFPDRAILVVDDEETVFPLVERVLGRAGFTNLKYLQDSRKTAEVLRETPVEVMLLDLRMPHASGAEILSMTVEEYPEIPVIMVTGVDDIFTVVACMRAGAIDYVVKPFEASRLVAAVQQAIEQRALRQEVATLRGQLQRPATERSEAFADIITRNRTMIGLMGYLESVASSPRPVLITGETGVGKDMLARGVHHLSGRQGALVPVNVGGLDDQMVSDTLFGHTRGAFTGADRTREGMVERAAGGTLFLDEIGDLSPASQAKLLRLVQQNEYYPLGSDIPRRTDARIIAATCHDLQERIVEGAFRRDLYFRLQVHQVEVPPLRERLDDLPLLLEHFVLLATEQLRLRRPKIHPDVAVRLAAHPFPGNVRELEAIVFEAVSRCEGAELTAEDFMRLAPAGPADTGSVSEVPPIPFHLCPQLPTIKQAADQLVREAMRRSNGKQTTAARMLGISQPALSKRLKGEGKRETD